MDHQVVVWPGQPSDGSPLIGRTQERVRLHEALDAAIAGHGRLVLIGGAAGIGKTMLVRDLAREARTRGALVLTGHCYDLTNTPPYGPWLDLVVGNRPGDPFPPPPTAFADGHLEGITSQAALFAEVRSFASVAPVPSSSAAIPSMSVKMTGTGVDTVDLPLMLCHDRDDARKGATTAGCLSAPLALPPLYTGRAPALDGTAPRRQFLMGPDGRPGRTVSATA